MAGLGGPRVGQRAQRRQVQFRDQHNGPVAGRQRDWNVGGRRELDRDARVMLVDAPHGQPDGRHRDDDDPRAAGELADEHDHQHHAGEAGTHGIDDAGPLHVPPDSRVGLGAQVPVPVPDHAGLAADERDEDADDVELDQPRRRGVECHDQQDREPGQQQDPVAERQPVAAGVQLARQVAIPGQDRGKDGEPVECGVGGENQDQRGEQLQHVEQRRRIAEYRAADLGDDGPLGAGR